MAHATKLPRPSPRERLLAAADELFYAEGVNSVGIERILERADVAKASLYKAFGSKEELIAAYLTARHARTRAELLTAVEAQSDPRARLLTVFDTQARWLTRRSYRGCAFALASAEAPPGGLVQRATEDYRRDVLTLLTRLAGDAGAADPSAVGLQLHLLYHGADVLAGSPHRGARAVAARAAAAALIDTAGGG